MDQQGRFCDRKKITENLHSDLSAGEVVARLRLAHWTIDQHPQRLATLPHPQKSLRVQGIPNHSGSVGPQGSSIHIEYPARRLEELV